MKNYDYWKKSQITDISTFCYWLHQKGLTSMDNLNYSLNQVCDLVELRDNLKFSLIYVHVLYNYFI